MKRILIVKDDFDIGEIVAMALDTRYQVLVKRDGMQLIGVLKQFRPDVMLIDNYIGHRDAKEIMEEIRASGFNFEIPFILFSGHYAIEKIAAQLGAADFLAKPFDLDDLHRCISRVLSFAEQQRQLNF